MSAWAAHSAKLTVYPDLYQALQAVYTPNTVILSQKYCFSD